MADDADLASVEIERAEERMRENLKPFQLDPGVPGECYECGNESPRLVAGMCARCRDMEVREELLRQQRVRWMDES